MGIQVSNRPILYSTGTELAYRISKKYYRDIHYVWCTSDFDSLLQPGTSNPRTLCNRLLDQIIKNDLHATEITSNRVGILKGAKSKFDEGVIQESQYEEIRAMVKVSEFKDFYPVIYIIYKKSAKKRCIVVSPSDTASIYSNEYKIIDLQKKEFSTIHLNSILSGVVVPLDRYNI